MVKIFSFFSFVLCYFFFLNGVCFTHCYPCLLFVYFGCAGSVGIFWRAGSYTFSVCDSAMWSAGPVQFYLGVLLERMAGPYRFLFLSGSVVAGTVRLKCWGGGPSFLLSLVCCQFSWRLDVCGRIFVLYISIFFGELVVFFVRFCVLKVTDFQ